MRLSTSPRILTRPVAFADTSAVISSWLSLPSTWVPQPTARHATVLAKLLDPETRADLVPDAHLATLAIEHGLLLCSTDRDFARFEDLRWTDPLTPPS